MLPQVLAGLGLVSVFSAGCVLVLQKLQPLFAVVAVAALAYEGWLVLRRPPEMRTAGLKITLALSAGVTALVFLLWIALELRYR